MTRISSALRVSREEGSAKSLSRRGQWAPGICKIMFGKQAVNVYALSFSETKKSDLLRQRSGFITHVKTETSNFERKSILFRPALVIRKVKTLKYIYFLYIYFNYTLEIRDRSASLESNAKCHDSPCFFFCYFTSMSMYKHSPLLRKNKKNNNSCYNSLFVICNILNNFTLVQAQ